MKNFSPILIVYINAFIVAMLLISVQANLPILACESGVSSSIIGAVLSLNPLFSIIFSIPFAIISDKLSRKAVIFTGIALSFFSVLITFQWPNTLGFSVAKMLEGMCMSAFFPSAMAYISDVSEKQKLSENIAKFTAVIYAGFLISPFLSGIIGKIFEVKAIFLFLSLIALINVSVSGMLFFKRKAKHCAEQKKIDDPLVEKSRRVGISLAEPKNDEKKKESLKNSITRPVMFSSIISLALIFGFLIGVIRTIWPIYLKDLNTDIMLINLSYTVYSLPIVLTSTYFGRWADRATTLSKPVMLGGLVIALGQLSYILIPIPLILTFVKVIEGFGYGILYPTSNTAMVKSVKENFKGRALGSYNFVRTSGQFIGTFSSGFMYNYLTILPFIANFFLMAIATIITGIILKKKKE